MISIIVPIFNVAPYLSQCLDSILAQTVSEWEAILVDDASTDGGADIAERYAKTDGRFRLIRQTVNLGQSAARNRGIDEAAGEYIVFLDSDDWLDPDFLERHLAAIGGCDIVQSGYRRISGGKVSGGERPFHRWQYTQVCMRMYRRSAVAGIRFTEGVVFEDVLWTVDVLLKKPEVNLTGYVGYNWRLRQGSTTSSRHEDDRRRIFSELKKKGAHPVVLYTIIRLRLYFIMNDIRTRPARGSRL